MLLWILSALSAAGLLISQFLKFRIRRSKRFYPRMSTWVVFLFTTVVSLVLYFNQVPIGAFFSNLSTPKVIGVVLSILLLLVVFELASPMNFAKQIFRKKQDSPREESQITFSEGEYEGFLLLIAGLVCLFLILSGPVHWVLGAAGASQEQAGLLCIVGILLVILLPVCIRQIVYYLIRIKHLKSDPEMRREDKSYEIVDSYLKRKNKRL